MSVVTRFGCVKGCVQQWGMRWEDLFADLEAQLESSELSELADEASDLAVAEAAATSWTRRLAGHRGGHVRLGLRDGRGQGGVCLDVGPAWLVLAEGQRRVLIPFGSVTWIERLAHLDAGDQSPSASRLDLGHALRVVADQDEVVTVVTADRQIDGWIARVGADYLELDVADGAGSVTVPFEALIMVIEAR